ALPFGAELEAHGPLPCRLALHSQLGLQAFDVPEDRRDGERSSVAFVAEKAVPGGNVAVDLYRIPLLRMADIVDRDIVMLAPEERDIDVLLLSAKHVESGSLPLPLRDYPMLHPDVVARMR